VSSSFAYFPTVSEFLVTEEIFGAADKQNTLIAIKAVQP